MNVVQLDSRNLHPILIFGNFHCTYLTLPATGAAVAKPLLKTKLRLAATNALRDAVLNNLGRTIVVNFGK